MRTTTLEERMQIAALAGEHTDAEIAALLGISLGTVRKWRRRAERDGLMALGSQMGRPAKGAMGTFSPTVQGVVSALRHSYPGWGPVALLTQMRDDAGLDRRGLPSRATLGRWIQQEGLSRRYERHRELPQPEPATAKVAHEAWEMDARGQEYVPDVGVISLVDLNDRFTRVKLMSYPCYLGEKRATRHPDTEDYQTVFRLTATEWGLPDRLYVDRDSVFFDNRSASPFPTRFHLWMLALGLDLVIGPASRPTERGMTERSHQTWDGQVLQGQHFTRWSGLRDALQQRRVFLNERMGCASCGGLPPLVAHPEARTPRRGYRPEQEEGMMDLGRVYAYLAKGQWFRKVSSAGTISLAQHIYCVGKQWGPAQVVVTFDPSDQHFVVRVPGEEHTRRVPAMGLAKADLVGQQGPIPRADGFQLLLPFT